MLTPATEPMKTPVATFAAGPNWAPVKYLSEKALYGKEPVRYTQMHAKLCEFVVVAGEGAILFKGFETAEAAEHFASSMNGRGETAEGVAAKVPPYWYVPGWGTVSPLAVHEYEPSAYGTTRAAGAVVLGCATV